MDECTICYDSPCTCIQSKPASGSRARASRRLPAPAPTVRRPVRKFSNSPSGELLNVIAKPEEPVEIGFAGPDAAIDEDEVMTAAILCFAPLLTDSELRRHNLKRPPPVDSLEQRRARFRADVVWSESRYV